LIDETQRTGKPDNIRNNMVQTMLKQDKPNANGEEIAIRALVWMAGNAPMMQRFLDLSGIDASQIRQAAQEPAFLAGVLNFILAHEPTLNEFADAENLHPSTVAEALKSLPGGERGYDQGSA
jgi:hypothetical protein